MAATNSEKIDELMAAGGKNRSVGGTAMNAEVRS